MTDKLQRNEGWVCEQFSSRNQVGWQRTMTAKSDPRLKSCFGYPGRQSVSASTDALSGLQLTQKLSPYPKGTETSRWVSVQLHQEPSWNRTGYADLPGGLPEWAQHMPGHQDSDHRIFWLGRDHQVQPFSEWPNTWIERTDLGVTSTVLQPPEPLPGSSSLTPHHSSIFSEFHWPHALGLSIQTAVRRRRSVSET